MKKKLLVFRFENVLIDFKPEQNRIQGDVWMLLRELKNQGYLLGLVTSIGFEAFVKAVTSSELISKTINSFDRLLQDYQPYYKSLHEITLFAEKKRIQLDEIVYFGNYYSHYDAVSRAKIDFIGVVDGLPLSALLDRSLPDDKKTHPALLAEFLKKYLELEKV